MAKQVIVILADGFEEIEALSPIDMLRRVGAKVLIAGLGKGEITSCRGVKITADEVLSESHLAEDWDAVVLPGGMPGSVNLHNSRIVNDLVVKTYNAGKYVCAICAAPVVVLSPTGILNGKRAVCYPGMEEGIKDVIFRSEKVLNENRIITARGAGCALEFALEIVSALFDRETADDLAVKIVY